MDAGDQLRFAFVTQKGRINSNFLEQAGWLEKIMHYVGFSPIHEDIRRAELGITSASTLAEFLVDTERVLTKYKTHIAAFQVPHSIRLDFRC